MPWIYNIEVSLLGDLHGTHEVYSVETCQLSLRTPDGYIYPSGTYHTLEQPYLLFVSTSYDIGYISYYQQVCLLFVSTSYNTINSACKSGCVERV